MPSQVLALDAPASQREPPTTGFPPRYPVLAWDSEWARRVRSRIGWDAQHSEWGERSDRVPLASTGVATDSPATEVLCSGPRPGARAPRPVRSLADVLVIHS